MNYKTVEVELEDGYVRPTVPETLPPRAHALLTLLDNKPSAALTCSELAERWLSIERLSLDEGEAFAKDVEQSRSNLALPKSAWD